MKIKSLYLRRFRSAESTALENCGGLNVLVGKNNAGKSNLLAAIELLLNHLKSGTVASFWQTPRVQEEFTDRDIESPLQIGMVFDFSSAELNAELRRLLSTDSPHLEKAVAQIQGFDSICLIVSGTVTSRGAPFLYVSHAGFGHIDARDKDLAIEGIRLLTVKSDVAAELFEIQRSAHDLRRQIDSLEEFLRNRVETAMRDRNLRTYFVTDTFRHWPELFTEVGSVLSTAQGQEDATVGLRQIVNRKREEVAELLRKETRGAMSAFAGDTKTQPPYIEWLMRKLGETKVIHFREEKQKIGTEEAKSFVRMKVRRGGPEQLSAIQQTIREL